MKVLAIVLAVAGISAAAPLNAQIMRNPAGDQRVSVNGSWQVVGRDGSGSTVYERSTRDRYGNIVVQRARRDRNGNMSVISTRTVRTEDRRNNNCDYNRSTNSIGDIIFGRSSDRYCDDEYSREDNGWYQVGRGRDNNSIYERRTRDRNGNLIIQRARRDSNGRMRIISTRRYEENDKHWKKVHKDDKHWKNGKRGSDRDGRWDGRRR
ncbi:MAG: hypothetical protein WD802_08210 [Gemmatimonadaceae bacterium]